ncbi:MAG: hypothetical protein R3D78_12855 [Paracoccaceae bacterium]
MTGRYSLLMLIGMPIAFVLIGATLAFVAITGNTAILNAIPQSPSARSRISTCSRSRCSFCWARS